MKAFAQLREEFQESKKIQAELVATAEKFHGEERVKMLEDFVRLEPGSQIKALDQLRAEFREAKKTQAELVAASEKLQSEFKTKMETLAEERSDVVVQKPNIVPENNPPPAIQALAVPLGELNSVGKRNSP
jgi:hypothetical protein